MAITKIHSIKATVARSVEYICNPEKTDSGILISSYATSPEMAAIDFKMSLAHTDANDPNLAYHLIQSFAPGEVDAQEAHRIGNELAERLLGGRYSYVLSTHTDRDHVHNHIIFCAADNFDHQKYHDCKASYRLIRQINDELCEEHNLSVIRDSKGKGKSYKEWLADKEGGSWKSQLKADINDTIKRAHSYEEFLDMMTAKGYEIKDAEIGESAHKYIAFRAPGQVRFIRGRAKSLGVDFTKERIRERIEEKARIRAERMKRMTAHPRMIDTTEERFSDSPGLKRWADKQNLKAAAKIQSELAGMGLKSLSEVDAKIEALHRQAREGKKATVALDKEIACGGDLLHYAKVYAENGKYIKGYEKSKDPDRYYRAHGDAIDVATAAIHRLKNAGLDPDRIDLHQMESDFTRLSDDRARTSAAYKAAEKECEKLKNLKENLASYMGAEQVQEIERDRKPIL